MAKTANIPESDHVLRYAKRKHLGWELDAKGNPIAVRSCYPDLFKLRKDAEFLEKHGEPESRLSVNWVEFFEGGTERQLQQTVQDFCSVRTIRKYDAFAKLNVGAFKQICRTHAAKVRIIHDAAKSTIKSHSSITQLPQDNALLFNDLCDLASRALIPATRFID